MGVPKFYRWISERYPCLSEVVKENQIPEFDNLYLDMNGIIHPCSHPNDEDVHFRITEEQIYKNIFQYIEVLFRIIKPRKVFFMAVDGVAPRAKMNQQRGRRFRSANEAEAREAEALKKGEKLPEEKRFDSNCITPGTHFMARLNEQLKYFVAQKLSQDRSWQGVRIYLSGHETPGEGEHKVMDFIRSEKLREDYDANTRHCLYGLDADLMMLGLASHEPHFSLLREEVRFGKMANAQRPTTAEETTFHLLHLSLFREYLDAEFAPLKAKLPPNEYDAEKIIDDWVLMGFLVGNDFIPHLPDLHINHNALPLLYQTYMDVRPKMKGYLNENGTLSLKNFEIYITKLAEYDREKFEEQFVDLSVFEGMKENSSGKAWKSDRVNAKKEAAKKGKELDNSFAVLMGLEDDPDWPDAPPTPGAAVTANIPPEEDEEEELDVEEGDQFEIEFRQHKNNYYETKFGLVRVKKSQIFVLAKEYVRAIQWILHYYFNGIQSWGWYYPYHYAPYMSDILGFSHLKLEFAKGEPFLPFQQLLGVLPAASREHLPETYQSLMLMDNSPIIDYYPVQFEQDLNGKQQSWEAVVLIPFIDEKRLLAAMEPRNEHLTEEERGRNRHSPHLMFTYDENLTYNYPSSLPGKFPDLVACHVRCKEISKMAFYHDPKVLSRGLRKGVKTGVYFPGFPTLHHLKYRTELSKEEVKVFQQNSRGDNMIIKINSNSCELDAAEIATDLLGKSIYVSWPHLREARVIGVAAANDEYRYELVESSQRGSKVTEQTTIKRVQLAEEDRIQWVRDVKQISDTYLKRKGVKIGKTEVLVYACLLMGRRYICGHSSVITLEKQWSSNPIPFAYQVTLKDIAVHDSTFKQFKTLEEIFPKDSECFMLGAPNYGCEGKVVEVENGSVRVIFTIPYEPTFDHIKNKLHQYETQYYPGYNLAKRLGVSSHLISRITGNIFMEKGTKESSIFKPGFGNRIALGLNLKFNKSSQEIPGYTKKEESGWLYSDKLGEVLKEYMQKFPELFEYIGLHNMETYYEADVFGDDTERLKDLQDWIKSLDCSKAPKVQIGHKSLSETAVKLIEEDLVGMQDGKSKKVRKMKMVIRPHLLYRSLDHQGNLIPDTETDYQLFDRVVNVREGYTIPLGLKGVVIGISTNNNILDCLYDVIFDEEFPGALRLRCNGSRGYRVPPTALINISYGLRKESGHSRTDRPTAVVKPQFSGGPQSQHTQSAGWYSDMMGKLGSNSGGQKSSRGGPRNNQRSNSRGSNQQDTAPNNFPSLQSQYGGSSQESQRNQYQNNKQTLPQGNYSQPSSHRSDRSHGKTSTQKPAKDAVAAPAFTLLTKSGPKKVGQSSTVEGGSVDSTTQRHGRKSETRRDSNKQVVEGSSNYAGVLKEGSKTQSANEVVSYQLQQQQRQKQPQKQQNKPTKAPESTKEVDEFANMWKQLQASDSENSAPNTPARNKGETAPAAKIGAVQPAELGTVEQSMQMSTSDIPYKPKGVIELVVNEEDRMSPRTFSKSGTAELCRMLNITGIAEAPSKPDIEPATQSESIEASPRSDTEEVTPSYGTPLTLDELFAGVFSEKEPTSPGPHQPPSSPRQPPPQHYPPSPQPQVAPVVQPAFNQTLQQSQSTLPISIPGQPRLTNQYPIAPVVIHPKQQGGIVGPALLAGSPRAAPLGSQSAAMGNTTLTSGSSVSSSSSSSYGHSPQVAQHRPITDPRTPPRPHATQAPSQYEGSPIQQQQHQPNVVMSQQQMLQSLRGPAPPHQAPPLRRGVPPPTSQQQFMMQQGPPGPNTAVLRGPPMVSRGPVPPNMFPGTNYTKMLQDWCWQHRLPPPQYQLFPNQKTGTIRAAVHLPNGLRFMGPDGVHQHAAVDMVSCVAMKQIDPSKLSGSHQQPLPPHGSPRQPPPPHHQPPPPHGSPRQPPIPQGSPRLPAPPQLIHGSPRQPPQPHGFPGHPGTPPHGSPMQGQSPPRYPSFTSQHMAPRPIRPTVGQAGIGLPWQGMPPPGAIRHLGPSQVPPPPLSNVGIPPCTQIPPTSPQVVIHARGSNPFVPLQVTRKLTPRKSSTSQDEDAELPPASPNTSGMASSPRTQPTSTITNPATMVTPPRKQYVPTTEAHQEVSYPLNPVLSSKPEDNIVKKAEGSVDDQVFAQGVEAKEETKKVVPRRRVPSKAKLAINFGGN